MSKLTRRKAKTAKLENKADELRFSTSSNYDGNKLIKNASINKANRLDKRVDKRKDKGY